MILLRYVIFFMVLVFCYFSESSSKLPTSERFSEVIVNRILFSQLVHLKHRGIYKCFGILISIYSVLIAAHCVHKLKPPAYGGAVIVVQYYNTTKQFQNYNIEYILVNKDFQIDIMARVETYANDIAVIVLQESVSISYQEFQIKSRIKMSFVNYKPIFTATIVGWTFFGTPNEREAEGIFDLKEINVTIIENKVCQKKLKMKIYASQICAISTEEADEDLCQVEHGSPLVRLGGIIGIASFTKPNPDLPGVYTRLASYKDFLIRALNHRPFSK